MKTNKNFLTIISLVLFMGYASLSATEISETNLKVDSGKMLFTLVKTMGGMDSKMVGLANQVTGKVDMKAKMFEFNMAINLESFSLSGDYKFANDRMHETYLESSKYNVASYKGTITSYDPTTGKAKVTGKMTIHGTTKDNVEIEGLVKPSESGNGYLLTSAFKVNLTDYKIAVPDIELAKVNEIVELKMKLELKSAK